MICKKCNISQKKKESLVSVGLFLEDEMKNAQSAEITSSE